MKEKKNNDKGVIYSNYLPLETTTLVTDGIKSKYALKEVNPKFYGKIKKSDILSLFSFS